MQPPRFDVPALPETYLSFYQRLLGYGASAVDALRREYGASGAGEALDVFCTDERAFNAFAWTRHGSHSIAFTAAAPCLLHFCFNHLLTHPYVLPHVGSVEGEQPRSFPNGIPLNLNTEAPLAEAVVLVPGISRPVDEPRAIAAAALTELAAMFTVLHEAGHLACGHTRYSETHFAGEPVSEFLGLESLLFRRRFLRQVWELEADMIAAMLLMNYLFGGEPTREFYSEAFGIGGGRRYEHEIVAAAVAALYTLFLYMNQAEKGDRRAISRSHPPPLVRISYIHNLLRLHAHHDFGISLRELDVRADESLRQVTDTWQELGMVYPDYPGDPLDYFSMLLQKRRRLARFYQDFAWVPERVWRTAETDMYSVF